MRIGMLVNNLSSSGGYQKLVLRLGAALVERGHDVTTWTVAANREACHSAAWSAMEVVSLGSNGDATPAAFRRLAALMPPDLDGLIIHDEQSLHALAALEHAPRTVWMLNNQLTVPALRIGDIVAEGRAAVRDKPRLLPYRLLLAARTLRERRLMRSTARGRVAAFAVYDRFNRADVQQHLGRDATIVFAGADVEAFEVLRCERPRPEVRPLRVLSVGVVFPHRRYEDVIRAVALARDAGPVELTIIGVQRFSLDHAAMLRALVTELGLDDHVTFREFVETHELHRLYREADVFAFVNDGHTWGIAVFEAVAAGLPVIITSNIGAVDLIEEGRHGWVVPPRDPEAVAAALRQAAAGRGPRGPEAERAREEVLRVVEWDAYAERMERLLAGP